MALAGTRSITMQELVGTWSVSLVYSELTESLASLVVDLVEQEFVALALFPAFHFSSADSLLFHVALEVRHGDGLAVELDRVEGLLALELVRDDALLHYKLIRP